MKATIKIGLMSVLAMAGTTFLRADFAFTSNFDGAGPNWNWDGVVETNSTVSGTDRMVVEIDDGAASSKGYVQRVLDTSGVSDSGGLSLNIGFDLDVSQLTGTLNYKSIRPFELSLNTGNQGVEAGALLQAGVRRENNDSNYRFDMSIKQLFGGVDFDSVNVNLTEAQRADLHMDIDFSMVEVTPGSNDGIWDLSAVLNVSALGSSVVTDLSLTGQNTDVIHLDDIDGYLFGMVKADNGLDGSAAFDNLSVSVIPEPSSLALLALSGLAALLAARRRVS